MACSLVCQRRVICSPGLRGAYADCQGDGTGTDHPGVLKGEAEDNRTQPSNGSHLYSGLAGYRRASHVKNAAPLTRPSVMTAQKSVVSATVPRHLKHRHGRNAMTRRMRHAMESNAGCPFPSE